MSTFIPGNAPLVFPLGTKLAHGGKTWAMYTNAFKNCTWIGYAVPGGTRIVQLPGIRSNLSADFSGIKAFVKQRQATACGACGD